MLMPDPSPSQPVTISTTSLSLLERVKARDPDAWQRLVRLYGPLVFQWCRRFDLLAEDAADLSQEVFRAVFQHIGDFRRDREGDSFRGWLWTITRNKGRDYFRRRRHEPDAAGGSDAHRQLQEIPDQFPNDGDSEVAGVAFIHRALDQIRDEFEERTWQMFWRVAVLGQAPKDIAAELAVTASAVRMAKSRVLSRLRDELT